MCGSSAPASIVEKEGAAMPMFMDVHDGFFGVSQEDVDAAHRRDLELEASEGVHFQRWWGDPTTGKVVCLAEGPNKEAVLRIHERAGHPTEQIYDLSLSGE